MSNATELHGPAHVARYLETDGADGYAWRNDTTILLLFTRGRKSGEERINALIFQPWQDAYLVVASKGGTDAPPGWFVNLQADPSQVEVQIKGERFKVTPRVADATEKPAMWKLMCEAWPDYDDYQTKTEREIPIVVLERAR
jgi:deazaflavin-dependent oxidoreductase (nitroreductase family)